MSLEILIRPIAEQDAEYAMFYISEYDKSAAKKFVLSIRKITNHLATFPEMGNVCGGKINLYRFLLRDYNYWILYTFSSTQLEVIRIIHTSRDSDF